MKKNFNKRELKLIKDIRDAESWIDRNNELEMDCWDGDWYAYEYDGDSSRPIDGYIDNPLIKENEIEAENVDVYAVFDHCKVAYCG